MNHPQLPAWSYNDYHRQLARQTLEKALNHVPFYQERKKYDPGESWPVEKRYAALPVLTKKDIRENFPAGMLPPDMDLNRALQSREINLVETSGTTDEKITNIWNQNWWDAAERGSWQLHSVMSLNTTGQHPEAILVNPKNVGVKSDEVDLPMEQRRLGRYLYLNEKTDPLTWSSSLMERMIDELNQFQPVVLEANPSYLARLSRYIASRPGKVFQPKAIVFTYEYPASFHLRQIAACFKSPLISSYGTTETGYVFMQCEEGLLHQNSDFCQVDFQPFKAQYGGPLLGRILVTPLGNPWCYYLHFDTGDMVEIESRGACRCGRSSGMILKAIAGRKVNLTLTPEGRPVTLLELDNALSVLDDIYEYQFVQTGLSEYNLLLTGENLYKSNPGQKAAAILRNIYGLKARINIIYTDSITPEVSGKYLLSKALFPINLEPYLDS
ncbi:MAG TPA: hypothetical protein VLH15_02205 [Dehalococcoidales bacterium]|nr:hypothetical protein [Dehalococcoidales bacterium]